MNGIAFPRADPIMAATAAAGPCTFHQRATSHRRPVRVYQAPQFTEARLAAPQPAITKTHGKDTMQGRSAFLGRKNGRRCEPVGVLQSGYVSRWPLVPRLGVLIRIDQNNVREAEIGPGVLIRNVPEMKRIRTQMSAGGPGRVKTRSDLVVMPCGARIFELIRSPCVHTPQKSWCAFTAQSFHTAWVNS